MRGSRSLHSLINCLFDLPPHASRMPQDLVTRNPQHLKSSFSQITVAVLIMPKTFGGLMVFTIDFNDQVQRYATKSTVYGGIGYSRRNFWPRHRRFRNICQTSCENSFAVARW